MADEHSEIYAILKQLATKPPVVRSLAWAAVFVAFGLLLHPSVVRYRAEYLGVFVVIALLFGLSMAKLTEQIYSRKEEPSSSEIVATRFVLADSEGRPLGFFGQADGNPFLTLGRTGGTGRVLISRSGLKVLDGEDKPRIILELEDADPVVTLRDSEGKDTVRLSWIGLDLVDTVLGESSISLTSFEGPSIEMKDSDGNVVWKAPLPA